jgi:hypothetical protein
VAEGQFELLVMGTHGRSGFRRLFVGSVTEHVLRAPPCATLVVPPRASAPPSSAPWRFRHIVCAVDFSTGSSATLAFALFGCSRSADSSQDTAGAVQTAGATNPNAPIMVRGSVVSVSANQAVLKSDTGNVTVTLTQPFHLFARGPSDLSHVKQSTFIGVTTVKQPDGSEKATEIHIFPEDLRGVGEGSRMMTPNAGANASRMTNGAASRMTNGSVSPSRMTNGTASPSRMSNGNVSSTNGSSLVVQYAGGSQTVTVPPNTPVTELKLTTKSLAPGDQVAIVATKSADGSLTADKAISTAKR